MGTSSLSQMNKNTNIYQFWSFFVPGLHKRQTFLFTFIYLSNSSIHNMFRHSALITWYLILDWQQKWWWITKNCTPNFHFLQQLTGKSESWAKMGLKTSTPQGCPLFLGCRSLSSFILKLHLAEFRNSSIRHIFSQMRRAGPATTLRRGVAELPRCPHMNRGHLEKGHLRPEFAKLRRRSLCRLA